jgi:multidrug efflux system membrane fusion protein
MRFPVQNDSTVLFREMKVFLVAALLMCWPAGCGSETSEKIGSEARTVEAQVMTIRSARLPVYSLLPGTVVSKDRIEVASRLSGYVYNITTHEGQSVKKDQLLFAVDPTGVKAEIRQAEAGLAKAKAALAEARANYDRYRNLYQEHSATKQHYEEMETAWNVAQGNYQAAEAAAAAATAQLKYAEVRAPLDALVVSKLADNGQLVGPGTPVLVLESQDRLQVQAQVDEQAFVHLRLGQEIPIQLQGSSLRMRAVTGSVERLVAAANPVTHTHLVKLSLPAGSGAWSGQYALVSIPVGEQEAIVVPPGAIYDRAGVTGVFVVTEEGRAQFRMVTLGKEVPQGRVVLSGLFSGDRVIVSAKEPLTNRAKIRGEPESRT